MARVYGWVVLLAARGAVVPALEAQQPVMRSLTLEQAFLLAESASEQVAIARAAVMRSQGELQRARSEYFPQLFATLGYTRTLASEFESLTGGGTEDGGEPAPTDCGTFTPDPSLSLSQRIDALEAAVGCQSAEDPFASFRDLPFGRENIWRFDLSASQTLFSGGRVQAQARIADAGRRTAELALAAARAQLLLDVAQAYFDAALARQLVAISEATMQQAETALAHVRLARDVGDESEFELLRAQVARDTQEPVVIQRRADFELADLRLRQLLNVAPDEPLALTSALDVREGTPLTSLVREMVGLDVDTSATRVVVLQAEQAVRVQDGLLAVAKAQRLPSLSLSVGYGRVGYPANGNPFDAGYRTNASISASVQLPLFSGFRIAAEQTIARAALEEAQARLRMTEELAALDTRDARARLAAAQSAWQASSGTVEQADRAHAIATVRHREGISTQLELNDARLVLQQAQANRAQAARDYQIAALRAALLPYLPVRTPGRAGGE